MLTLFLAISGGMSYLTASVDMHAVVYLLHLSEGRHVVQSLGKRSRQELFG